MGTKRGAKTPGGMDKVLYVRCGGSLLERLDQVAERWRAESPGMAVSRSDVARRLLEWAMEEG